MTSIADSYKRLAAETDRPCYSVTFWRTVRDIHDNRWGARAGLGDTAFGESIEDAIEAAVTNAIVAQHARNADPTTPDLVGVPKATE